MTYEVRDGIISHCGESIQERKISAKDKKIDLENIKSRKEAGMPATIEGCIVRMVDKITYAGRDVEDALAAKLLVEQSIPQDVKKTLGNNNGEIIGTLPDRLLQNADIPHF